MCCFATRAFKYRPSAAYKNLTASRLTEPAKRRALRHGKQKRSRPAWRFST